MEQQSGYGGQGTQYTGARYGRGYHADHFAIYSEEKCSKKIAQATRAESQKQHMDEVPLLYVKPIIQRQT